MKECEWCGIDFRGPYKTLDEHFFCSDGCINDWRRDVFGDAAVDAQNKAAAKIKTEAETDESAQAESDPETEVEQPAPGDGI